MDTTLTYMKKFVATPKDFIGPGSSPTSLSPSVNICILEFHNQKIRLTKRPVRGFANILNIIEMAYSPFAENSNSTAPYNAL